MNVLLQLEVRRVYGNIAIYPVGRHADAIGVLTGKKTLDARDLAALRSMGVELVFDGLAADVHGVTERVAAWTTRMAA
jgi:hypothetical protein